VLHGYGDDISISIRSCGRRKATAPAVAEPIAVAADVDGGGVVQEPVEQGGGEDGIGKDLAPLPVALVAGQDDGLPGLVATADDLEEEGGVGPLEGQVADLVEEEEIRAGDDAQ